MIKIRMKNDPNAHAFEEEMLNAECSGDEEYERKLEFLQETIGMLGFPVELNKEWIDIVKCRYREPQEGLPHVSISGDKNHDRQEPDQTLGGAV